MTTEVSYIRDLYSETGSWPWPSLIEFELTPSLRGFVAIKPRPQYSKGADYGAHKECLVLMYTTQTTFAFSSIRYLYSMIRSHLGATTNQGALRGGKVSLCNTVLYQYFTLF